MARFTAFYDANVLYPAELRNLLAQGYRPFVSDDGQMLFLAQAPRTMQAGLAFTF